MGSDAPPQFFSQPQGFSVSISVESTDEAERIFKELADGGTVRMPLQETFWAKRFGMLIDRFGTPWMVNCESRHNRTGTNTNFRQKQAEEREIVSHHS